MVRKYSLSIAILVLPSIVVADTPPPKEKSPAPKTEARSQAEFAGGLWPSPRLTELMLVRWADQMGYQYELEDEQRKRFRKAIVDRWAPFLQENRSRFEPVVNEFLEMRLELEPPSKERLKSWADKAMPAFELMTKEIDGAKSDLRKILTPMQRIEFEVHAMEFGLGLKVAESRIRTLQSGEFEAGDFREFWQPTAEERRRRREAREAANMGPRAEEISSVEPNTEEAERKKPTDPIMAELDAWERFVMDFGRLHEFDEGQRTTASSLLIEFKNRAMTHRDRRLVEIQRLEERIAKATGDDDEMKEIEAKLNELYGPIDEMFAQLKGRVELIPTQDQRAAAQLRKKAAEQPSSTQTSETKPDSEIDQEK